MKKFIYLAGPIAGCDKGEANDWRERISAHLTDGIVGISPLRCEPLIGDKYELAYDDKRFGTPAAINGKNLLDVGACDLILAYLPDKSSLGTITEIAWGMVLRKPIILVSGCADVVNHPLYIANIGWILDNFDDALSVIHGLFEDYVDTKKVWPRVTLDLPLKPGGVRIVKHG